jgi:hypothetical protein
MTLTAAVLLAAAVDAQVAVGPVIGLAGWALDDPDHHNKVRPSANGSTLRVTSDTRVFLVKDSRKTLWADHEYLKIDLRSGPLRFTLDLSGVPCGCLACVYLVAMQDPSRTTPNYCDIYGSTGGKVCLEADILEANNVAFSTNLHTRAGVGHDGTCNAWGCLTTLGPTASPQERKAYGPGRGFKVDTRHPFDVEVNMDDQGGLSVNLLQGSSRVVAFDPHKAGNPQGRGLPPDALRAFREAMGRLTLVASLWSTGTANEWLEGKCMECVLGQATYTLSDLRLGNLGQFRNIPPGLPPPYPLENVRVNLCTSYRTHLNSTMNHYMVEAMVEGGGCYAKEPSIRAHHDAIVQRRSCSNQASRDSMSDPDVLLVVVAACTVAQMPCGRWISAHHGCQWHGSEHRQRFCRVRAVQSFVLACYASR